MKPSPSEPAPAPLASRPATAARHRGAVVRFLTVALVTLAVDLLSKHAAFRYAAGDPVDPATAQSADLDHQAIALIPGVLNVKLMLNPGAAFGLGPGGRWIFIAVAVAAVGIIVSVFRGSRPQARVLHAALSLILAGALGNLYDRIVYARVRDLLWLFPDVNLPFGWRWPGGSDELYPWVFNVADAAMCIGLIVLILQSLGRRSPQRSDS